jgi:hypothetical protein
MARFAVSGRATIAGTSALPLVSLYATATVRPVVVEVGIWNTTATAVTVSLNRLSSAGTQGTGLSEVAEDSPDHTAIATGFAGHTAGPTVNGELRRATLGAAVGSGVIWTFSGLEIPAGTGNGLGLIIPTGTGQVLDYSIVWVE